MSGTNSDGPQPPSLAGAVEAIQNQQAELQTLLFAVTRLSYVMAAGTVVALGEIRSMIQTGRANEAQITDAIDKVIEALSTLRDEMRPKNG